MVPVGTAHVGCVTVGAFTTGGGDTLSDALDDVTLVHELVNTALYCLLLSAAAAVKVKEVLVAPVRLAKLAPPSVLTCH
jgi:hypothetical protein